MACVDDVGDRYVAVDRVVVSEVVAASVWREVLALSIMRNFCAPSFQRQRRRMARQPPCPNCLSRSFFVK